MQCPACRRQLVQREVHGVTVDVCDGGCGGIWFDNFEFQKIQNAAGGSGEELLRVQRDPALLTVQEQKRPCPKCPGVTMQQHFWSVKRRVVIDECPSCGGMWLDYGELGHMEALFGSEEERREEARRYFAELFGEKLGQMHAESKKQAQRARRIADLFRFICPSYWIPGRQSWGAW